MELPHWWEWPIEVTSHLERRMEDRDFTEVDLRKMLDVPHDLRKGATPGRWIVEVRHGGKPWEVVVEPEVEERLLVVVTAYPRH